MPEAARNNSAFLPLRHPLFAVLLVGSLKDVSPVGRLVLPLAPQQMRRYMLRDDNTS